MTRSDRARRLDDLLAAAAAPPPPEAHDERALAAVLQAFNEAAGEQPAEASAEAFGAQHPRQPQPQIVVVVDSQGRLVNPRRRMSPRLIALYAATALLVAAGSAAVVGSGILPSPGHISPGLLGNSATPDPGATTRPAGPSTAASRSALATPAPSHTPPPPSVGASASAGAGTGASTSPSVTPADIDALCEQVVAPGNWRKTMSIQDQNKIIGIAGGENMVKPYCKKWLKNESKNSATPSAASNATSAAPASTKTKGNGNGNGGNGNGNG